MHVRAAGRATHVLFMDDDVSFDPEIVFRTIALLSFANDPNLCIAGAMLASERPTELFEAGAQYRGRSLNPNRALGQGLDLEAVHDLLVAELDDDPIDYGAWWFSAFPVALTPDNPAPTFVRGDDVLWGLLHTREHTITSNGIGLWHEGFERKNGPITWFYETRNFALVGVLAVPGYRWWHALFRYVNLCARSLFSLKYASAANITFAMREFLLGPEHWMTNDQSALNDRVAGFDGERIEKLPPELCRVDDLPRPHGAGRVVAGVLSIGTLGGHLLPPALDRRPLGAVPLQHRVLGASPGHAAILYRDDDGTHGYLAPRDRRRFLALFGEMVRTAGRIPWSFGRVGRAYRRAYPQMVGDDYWRRQVDPDADELGDVATLVPA
jgi:hypothetical protein